MNIECVECKLNPGEFRVEQTNDDGVCFVTIFTGGEAQRRALEYHGFLTSNFPMGQFAERMRELIDGDRPPFEESLAGFAAAAAAASMLNDWANSDDGTGYLTQEVKQSDAWEVIAMLTTWQKTLTATPPTK